ncbi:nucleotidyltransferase domain-containing protein [Metallosphaera hakonensis]|nr:nucleotidyltransferase domain-containing protein [Metallosphaera hakonensis]
MVQKIIYQLAENFPLKEVYVFGSRARGDYKDTSDIDLIFVIEGIKGIGVVERMEMISPFIKGNVDFVVISPEEKDGYKLMKGAKKVWGREEGFLGLPID